MTLTAIQQAVTAIRQGGIIAYPTEAVWGLGCDPLNRDAVQQLLALKQRPQHKGLILIASRIEQFAPFLAQLTPAQYRQLEAAWPGFQTWIVPASPVVPEWIRGDHCGVALRVSAHKGVQELCEAWGGPLVSTSANPAGQPPAMSADEVRAYFPGQLAYVLPGTLGGAARPSAIIDLVTGKPVR